MFLLRKIFDFYRAIVSNIFSRREDMVQVHCIDNQKKIIIINMRGIKSPIHLGFEEIIKDRDILNCLPSIQACYVGYSYGSYLYNCHNKSNYPEIPFDYLIDVPMNKHRICMLDRQKNLIYLDRVSGNQYSKSPIQIMLDKSLLIGFSSLQSCYIGILSGIANGKIKDRFNKRDDKQVQLKLLSKF